MLDYPETESLKQEKPSHKTRIFSQIVGWLLLFAGIILISYTLISSYHIFTGKTEAPAIFKAEIEEVLTPAEPAIPTTPAQLQQEMEKMVSEQIKEVLPLDALPKMLNLAVWSMLAFILIFGGSQVSSLGIKLIKNP